MWVALSGSFAGAQNATNEQLQQQIRELQERVQALERERNGTQEEVRRTVELIVRDAEQRSHLLAIGEEEITAGYDDGFFIRSQDDNFALRPGLLIQFRNITSIRTGADGDAENGFEIRRLRPRLDGHLYSKDFTYSVVWDASRSTGEVSLLDAWVQWRFSPHWSIKGGQFRNSWIHEGDVSDSGQLAVERSLVDAILGGSETDRVQGFALIYGPDELPVRLEATYHDGANSKNTSFQDVGSDFGMSGRAEYKLAGEWADYRDFTARDTKHDLLVLGAGAGWTQSAGSDVIRTTIDAQYETPGRWGIYGALQGNIVRTDGESDFEWAAIAQAGYSINRRWEPFARYTLIAVAEDGLDTYNEFAVGANYYLGENGDFGHRAKFTFDLLYLPEGAPQDETGTGVLQSDEAEIVLRGQFQLML